MGTIILVDTEDMRREAQAGQRGFFKGSKNTTHDNMMMNICHYAFIQIHRVSVQICYGIYIYLYKMYICVNAYNFRNQIIRIQSHHFTTEVKNLNA